MTRTAAIQRLAALCKLEWEWAYSGPQCPVCKARKAAGHLDACNLAAFIADMEDEARERRELRARLKGERGGAKP